MGENNCLFNVFLTDEKHPELQDEDVNVNNNNKKEIITSNIPFDFVELQVGVVILTLTIVTSDSP